MANWIENGNLKNLTLLLIPSEFLLELFAIAKPIPVAPPVISIDLFFISSIIFSFNPIN